MRLWLMLVVMLGCSAHGATLALVQPKKVEAKVVKTKKVKPAKTVKPQKSKEWHGLMKECRTLKDRKAKRACLEALL